MRRFLQLEHQPPPSVLARLDARVKLVCLLALLLAVVGTRITAWPRLVALAAVLAVSAAVARLPAKWLAARIMVLVPFLALVTIVACLVPPSAPEDAVGVEFLGRGLSRSALLTGASVIVKSMLALCAFVVAVGASDVNGLLAALSWFRAPRLAVSLLTLAYRYLFVLADELSRMMIARDSRGRPTRWRRRIGTAAAMAGTLFVRTYERSERIAIAMVSRGFAGRFPTPEPGRLPGWHALAAGAFCASVVLLAFW